MSIEQGKCNCNIHCNCNCPMQLAVVEQLEWQTAKWVLGTWMHTLLLKFGGEQRDNISLDKKEDKCWWHPTQARSRSFEDPTDFGSNQ